jgi:hypothetical protein
MPLVIAMQVVGHENKKKNRKKKRRKQVIAIIHARRRQCSPYSDGQRIAGPGSQQ